MPAFLTLDTVSAATPDGDALFRDLTLAVGAERIGLVGRNGSGKSTLLRIMAGDLPPAGGSVTRAVRTGTLAQHWDEARTVAFALGVQQALSILGRVIAGIGNTADFEAADWTLEERITMALASAGLPDMPLERPIASLSGGERTRVGIARLLIEAPDLLLLDEPTNNLDADGRAAIAALLRDWRGGAIVASHDRELLETMDRIVELTPIGIRIVSGGWSSFSEIRERERSTAAREHDRAEADLRTARRTAQHQREAKDRRDKAGRAFAAKGSEPKILLGAMAERAENSGSRTRALGERLVGEAQERADAARAAVEVVTPLTIDIPGSSLPSGARVLALRDVAVTFGDRKLGPWNLEMTGPERIAVTGANSTGKSTLLKTAAGKMAPSAGTVHRAEDKIAMLDQHCGLLDPGQSVLANFRLLNPGTDDHHAHAACARFAFRNRDMLQDTRTLSGGERLRAALACTLGGKTSPWLLILDEPTNHLDIESLEVLESALCRFDGALLVVSHDPAFLRAIGIERSFAVGQRNPQADVLAK